VYIFNIWRDSMFITINDLRIEPKKLNEYQIKVTQGTQKNANDLFDNGDDFFKIEEQYTLKANKIQLEDSIKVNVVDEPNLIALVMPTNFLDNSLVDIKERGDNLLDLPFDFLKQQKEDNSGVLSLNLNSDNKKNHGL